MKKEREKTNITQNNLHSKRKERKILENKQIYIEKSENDIFFYVQQQQQQQQR